MAKTSESEFISKRAKVKNRLRDDILLGKYALGAKIESERTLIDRFNVSRIVIRQALDDLESERLIIRQQGRGTFVSSPLHSRKESNAKIDMIGIMVPDLLYMYDRTIRGASSTAVSQAYSVATSCFHSCQEEADNALAFIQNGITGVLIAPSNRKSRSTYETFQEHKMPVVFIDIIPENCDEDYVKPDNHKGTATATKHLIELGHRRIAYVSHCPSSCNRAPGLNERLNGFAETMKLNNLQVHPNWIIAQEEDEVTSKIIEILRSEKPPTAFVTYNDAWAIRTILACRRIELKVPQDISVVGFDNSKLPAQHEIPLTTIEPEHHEMGIVATELILKKIQNPQPKPKKGIIITPRLIQRNSTQKLES